MYQLEELLVRAGYNISLSTILQCRLSLGWTFHSSAYCQLIKEANKAKRLQFAQDNLHDIYQDVIWTDECAIQMESHQPDCRAVIILLSVLVTQQFSHSSWSDVLRSDECIIEMKSHQPGCPAVIILSSVLVTQQFSCPSWLPSSW